MGIDELLNFIESKDNNKGGKKSKKNTNTSNKNNTKYVNLKDSKLNSAENQINSDRIGNSGQEEACGNNQEYDDSELEQFKNKLLGDSINAREIKKIKPNLKTYKWD